MQDSQPSPSLPAETPKNTNHPTPHPDCSIQRETPENDQQPKKLKEKLQLKDGDRAVLQYLTN